MNLKNLTPHEQWRAEIVALPDWKPMSSEPDVGVFLFALARMIQAKRVLEVGVWMGYTQTYLLEALPPSGESWAIDVKDRRACYFELYDKRHHFVEGNSWEEIPKLPGLFDLAFLDTSHVFETTCKELDALRPKMATGGIVCCHDVASYEGVRRALFGMNRVELKTPADPDGYMNGLAMFQFRA